MATLSAGFVAALIAAWIGVLGVVAVDLSATARRVYFAALILVLAVFSAACGGSVSGPTGPPSEPAAPVTRMAPLPSNLYGSFTASEDVREAAANAGNVILVVPSYVDSAESVAGALQANGKVGILSAHHVFGNAPATWEEGWAQTKRWAAPLLERSLITAVLVVDEPLHNGVPATMRDDAIARVRRDGFRVLQTEWVDRAVTSNRPAGVDLYGVTCYYWNGPGSWSLDRCMEAYRTHPSWDLVIGQGWDVEDGSPGSRYQDNGTVAAQVQRWAELGRARSGVLFWVWRWPGQEGIGDNPVLRSAYNRAGGR